MLPDINLISNRNFKIRNFEEDKIATLEANPGLRFDGKINDFIRFSGEFYLTNHEGNLIESFGLFILIPNSYPNAFPVLLSTDGKIEKSDDFHINTDGTICVEHTYVANKLASYGLRVFDFVNYYLPKYFSWVLLKQSGVIENLQEWGHRDRGTIQFYESLLNTNDKSIIKQFLEGFLKSKKIKRNDLCYCGSGKKLKICHYKSVLFLNPTPREQITNDISLFC